MDPNCPEAQGIWDALMQCVRVDDIAAFAGAATAIELKGSKNLRTHHVADHVCSNARGW